MTKAIWKDGKPVSDLNVGLECVHPYKNRICEDTVSTHETYWHRWDSKRKV